MDNYLVEGGWIYCRIVFPNISEFGSLIYHDSTTVKIGRSTGHIRDDDFMRTYTSYTVKAFLPVIRIWWGQ